MRNEAHVGTINPFGSTFTEIYNTEVSAMRAYSLPSWDTESRGHRSRSALPPMLSFFLSQEAVLEKFFSAKGSMPDAKI